MDGQEERGGRHRGRAGGREGRYTAREVLGTAQYPSWYTSHHAPRVHLVLTSPPRTGVRCVQRCAVRGDSALGSNLLT